MRGNTDHKNAEYGNSLRSNSEYISILCGIADTF